MQVKNIVFWVCLVASILLMGGGFFAPPMGVIDNSVLVAVGILFGFAVLWQLPAMIKGRSVEVSHGNTTITIGDDD